MNTKHKVIFGNCMSMAELSDQSIHLIVTSPPYFNAPFDYKGLFDNYEQYLGVLKRMAKEAYRVLQEGRIFALNIDDMLVNGQKYPITADAIKILQNVGFRYRDKIIWKKPDGYLRISRRSGVLLQNPYPMYFYPDNLLESIIIFQKGKFDYRSISKEIRQKSKIDINEFQNNEWLFPIIASLLVTVFGYYSPIFIAKIGKKEKPKPAELCTAAFSNALNFPFPIIFAPSCRT